MKTHERSLRLDRGSHFGYDILRRLVEAGAVGLRRHRDTVRDHRLSHATAGNEHRRVVS
jgi:hypothetical protein